jgi:hypothetical protein
MERTAEPDFVALANRCLAGAEPMALLRIYEFAGDFEAHDNVLQERLDQEFEQAFANASEVLSAALGPGRQLTRDDDNFVPLDGVFCAMEWHVGGQRLYLAAAHEDRETPFLLVLGVER